MAWVGWGTPFDEPEPFHRVGIFDVFGLPRELRNNVYTDLLHPEDLNSYPHPYSPLGCTSIMCVNRQARAEALELFERKERVLHVDCERSSKLFRSMFAFGKPSFRSRETEGMVPQRYSELQVVRFTMINIKITYPYLEHGGIEDRDQEFLNNLQHGIDQIIQCLSKSTSLQTLRLSLQPSSHPRYEDDDFPWSERCLLACGVLNPLLALAKTSDTTLFIDTNQFLRGYRNPAFRFHDWVDPLATMLEDAWQNMKSTINISNHSDHITQNTASNSTPARLPGDDYKLVPECRVCYKVYGSRADLMQHVKQAKHASKYRPKTENQLYSTAAPGTRGTSERPRYICFTCGQPFHWPRDKTGHCDAYDHWRSSIVSRWVEHDWQKEDKRNEQARRVREEEARRHQEEQEERERWNAQRGHRRGRGGRGGGRGGHGSRGGSARRGGARGGGRGDGHGGRGRGGHGGRG